jgi:hypothetical protein
MAITKSVDGPVASTRWSSVMPKMCINGQIISRDRIWGIARLPVSFRSADHLILFVFFWKEKGNFLFKFYSFFLKILSYVEYYIVRSLDNIIVLVKPIDHSIYLTWKGS